jgi:predicted transcriptional regulator
MSSLAISMRYDAAMMTPAQIRAARALLGWKQTDLAAAAGVSEISVKNIERGATDARGSTLAKIQAALEAAGLEVIPSGSPSLDGGPGVRRRHR